MTTKVNGAAFSGVWAEKKVSFVKLTFSTDIAALAAASLYEQGTTTAPSTNTVADSTFGIVESAIVQALKTLETQSTVLGVSAYDATAHSVDVMLGNASSWFSDANGLIASALPVLNANAVITVAGTAPVDAVGALVSVAPSAVTFNIQFAAFDGKMTVGTSANGTLVNGLGATSGATPTNSPTGTYGYAYKS